MKPLVADEMFPEHQIMDLDEAGGGSSSILMDGLAEKHVHADFYNDFDDIFDEDQPNEGGDYH